MISIRLMEDTMEDYTAMRKMVFGTGIKAMGMVR